MYGKMKYVRFVDFDGLPQIIVFSSLMNHRETIKRIRHQEVISAGFVYQDREGKLQCTGRSESLGIDSKPEQDSLVLQTEIKGL